jgi:hypothetical protein
LGALDGEGQWSGYIRDAGDQVVAYRTFLQPDAERPYAVVAVVALDLNATRLGFVLGSEEPASEVKGERTGRIPEADFKPGRLLAVFNGGFKARHGKFGAMANGLVALPPRDGLGTVALYADGRIGIGAWGRDIRPNVPMLAWRQNGPLIVQAGVINPHTADNDPKDWGYTTVDNETATWRSGLGLSEDGQKLYYAAGPKLTVEALAHALRAAGAYQAVQLDINNYWVHFDGIQAHGDGLQTLPLFESMGAENDRRYLQAYTRDYFYVTSAK